MCRRHRQQPAHGAIRVVAQALRIGHGQQQQIQRERAAIAALDVALTHHALVDPAELSGNAPQALRAPQAFDRHARDGHYRGCLGPVVAAAGRWRRCPLVTGCRSGGRLTQSAPRLASGTDLVTPKSENLLSAQGLGRCRDLVTHRPFPHPRGASSPDAALATRAHAQRAGGRRSSCGSRASRASDVGWQLCSPPGRRPLRSTSAGRGCEDPHETTHRSTGTCVFLFAASTRPPSEPIMHANGATRLSGHRLTACRLRAGEQDDLYNGDGRKRSEQNDDVHTGRSTRRSSRR